MTAEVAACCRRVFLVDDHPIVLKGIASMIANELTLEVVGTAGDCETAQSRLMALEVDIVIIDVSLPGLSGIELLHRIKKTLPLLKTLILTVHEEASYIHQALKAGADGFLAKRCAADGLIQAIHSTLAGGMYVDPTIAGKLLRPGSGTNPMVRSLSDREAVVMKLVSRGLSNKEISALLDISVKTVETYRARANEKLGIRSRAELVRHALREGWMSE
jgi:DNA-binding NarL/FixJ family response regulator